MAYNSTPELAPPARGITDAKIEHHPDSAFQKRKGYSLWVVVVAALLAAIVAGAVVGGAVGSQIGNNKSSSSAEQKPTATITETMSFTSTVTATSQYATASGGLLKNYQVVSPKDVYTVPLDCKDGQTYNTNYWSGAASSQFEMKCSTGLIGGDIATFVAYSFQDCMEACAGSNIQALDKACTAVVFHSLMNPAGQTNNCWLKNSSTIIADAPFDGAYNADLSAVAHLSL